MQSDYMGTLSAIPVRRTSDALVTPTSSKRERGKVKGNKRRPRTHTIAVTDCIVTRADGTSYTIAKRATRAAAKKVTAETVRIAESPERAAILAQLEAMRKRESFDQAHRETYT